MTDTPSSQQTRFNVRALLQPAWLAGILSVGFHGVLFAAGPTFPSLGFDQLTETEAAAERRNVPLVELTAAEQERLPDFSGSFYDFSNFSDLESLPPLSGGSPNARSNSSDRPINSQPLLSPSGRSTPPSASRLPFGITRLESNPRSPFPPSGGALPPIQTDGDAAPDVSDTSPDVAPDAAADPPPGADALRAEDGELEVSAQEEAAIAANSNPMDTLSLEERLQAFVFDSTNTDTDAIANRFGGWLETGQTLAADLAIGDAEDIQAAFETAAAAGILSPATEEDGPAADDAPPSIVRRPIELPIDYGAGICLTKEPQKGLIGAWISPEGELLEAPAVIRSTGYAGLNQQAIQYIETLDFSTVDTFTGYQFEVVVNYDPEDCVDIGRSTPAAPADAASRGGDRSSSGRATPDQAPAKRPQSGDLEAVSSPSPSGETAPDAEAADPEPENTDAEMSPDSPDTADENTPDAEPADSAESSLNDDS